ncbi:MAG: DUF3883 domain-containing protein [archaeon]
MDRIKVRDKAMDVAEKYERKRGQFIRRVDKGKNGKFFGYDILSKDRKIEVKGRTGADRFVQMNEENIEAFKDRKFWLYIVHFGKNDKCDQIIALDKNTIETGTHPTKKETKRKKSPRRQWEIRFWTEDPNQIFP